MYTIKSRSVFQYLLAGLLVAICVLSSVDAAPTGSKKAVGKAGPKAVKKALPIKAAPVKRKPTASKGKIVATKGKAAPAKGKKGTPKAAAGGAAFCPIRKPVGKGKAAGKGMRLQKRTTVTHPPGNGPMILFHGTKKEFADSVQKPDLTKTHTAGDLHHNKNGCVKGGMYFTDSVIAAAQYVCHRFGQPNPDTAYVLKYKWNPPATLKVHTFAATEEPDDKQCGAHDMVTSAMHNLPWDKDLTTDFWQYAIVQQDAMDNYLQYEETFVIPCANVPKGAAVTSDDYIKGQGTNAGFTEYVQGLVSGSGC